MHHWSRRWWLSFVISPSGYWCGLDLVDDREALLKKLQTMPQFDLLTMFCEVGQVAWGCDKTCLFGVDVVSYGGLPDDRIEVVPAFAECGAVELKLRPLDRELHRLSVRTH